MTCFAFKVGSTKAVDREGHHEPVLNSEEILTSWPHVVSSQGTAESVQVIAEQTKKSKYSCIRSDDELNEDSQLLQRARKLDTHSTALVFVSMFATVTIVSWVFTCFLSFKPIEFAAYLDHTGQTSAQQYDVNERWRKAARTLSSVISAITIPLTSTVCAKAAVVFCQRNTGTKSAPDLTMRQTLALADKGWTDLAILNSMVNFRDKQHVGSRFLVFSALLCGIGEQAQEI